MNFWKRLITINVLIFLLGNLIGCSKEDKIPYSLEIALESYSSETTMDEILAQAKTIKILENQLVTDQNLLDSIKKLQQYLEFIEEVEILGIRDEKLIQKQQERQNWIKDNGLRISKKLLSFSIQSIACEAYGISGEYYKDCAIIPDYLAENEKVVTIEIIDPFLLATNKYYVTEDSSKTLFMAFQTLYNIQKSSNNYDITIINDLCKKSLDTSKILIASSAFIEDSKIKTTSAFDKTKTIF